MATYYVATTGSDSNNGLSVGAPKATIAQALALITTGTGPHTIYVADGTYTGGISVNKAGASDANRITVIASGTGAVISGGSTGITISAHYVTVQGFEITGFTDRGVYALRRNYAVIRDCHVHDGGGGNPDTGIRLEECQYAIVDGCQVIDINGNGLYFIDCSYCTMSDNEVTRAYPDGISISGIYNTVDGNTVTEMNSGSAHGDGIIVACPEWSTAPYLTSLDTVGTILRNNVIKDCTQYIYLDAYNYSNGTVRKVADTYIYNNVLTPGTSASGFIHQGISIDPETENIENLYIYNNTIVGIGTAGNGGGQGISFGARTGCTLTGLYIKNNVLYDSPLSRNNGSVTVGAIDNNLYYGGGISTMIRWSPTNGYYTTLAQFQAATIYEDNGIEADPLFTSASDFTLRSSSPAIDAGADDAYNPDTDFNGVTRTSPDIGAYEYAPSVTYRIERRVV